MRTISDQPSPVAADNSLPVAIRRRSRNVALIISISYLLFSELWIACSDGLLEHFARNAADPVAFIDRMQTLKGAFFVGITAIGLFLLTLFFTRSVVKNEASSQEEAKRAAGEYALLFDRNPFAMWVFHAESLQILAVNDQATITYGYTRKEFLAIRTSDLEVDKNTPYPGAQGLQSPQPQYMRVTTHERRSGERLHVEIITSPLDFHGEPARLALCLDVSKRLEAERALETYRAALEHRVSDRTKELYEANLRLQEQIVERQDIERQLRAAKKIAEDANKSKSIFLAKTSHEIRTPLTSILGYADLLLDADLSESQREHYIGVLQQNANHLLKLVDDFLDLSRIDAGKMRVVTEEYSPQEIAEQSINLLKPRAAEKGLDLTLHIADELPLIIQTDGVRLRQVLLNLLSNAIKFTEKGTVSLTVSRPEDNPTEGIIFEVSDTGIGMRQEHLERIFDPFFQVEQGENRLFGGTGLGLAISKQLIEQMGGTISLTSTLDVGSTFRVRLPVMIGLPISMPYGPTAFSQIRIDANVLLAEDNTSIRWLVQEYLRRAGATVTAVSNGSEAVDAIRHSMKMGATHFDLLLMDINMPTMGGLEAVQLIRSAGFTNPIVALTAHALPEEKQQWLDAGYDIVAPKPIDRQTFIPLVASLLPRRNTLTHNS